MKTVVRPSGDSFMKALFFLIVALAVATPLGASEVDSRTTTIDEVRRQVSRSSDIDAFVWWLKERKNVSEVDSQPIFLTTAPSQQWVSFSIGGKRYRFRLMKEVVSAGGSDRTIVKEKVLIMGEDGSTAKKLLSVSRSNKSLHPTAGSGPGEL